MTVLNIYKLYEKAWGIRVKDINDLYFQIKNEYFVREKLGREQWIQVSGEKEMNSANAVFYCGLINLENLDSIYRDVSWDITEKSCYPGFYCDEGENSEYKSNCDEDDGKEVIVYNRDFYGIKPNTTEISQEFVLLNNLYYEEKDHSYYSVKADGQCDQAIRIEGDVVWIKLSYLMRYISAKQKALLLYFDIKFLAVGSLNENGLQKFNKDIKDDYLFYSINGGELTTSTKIVSRILGKKILLPRDKKTCGYWPFEKEREYVDYIIGVDDCGEPLKFTSNPDKLSNYFVVNEGAPHYLTPVFFKREVLQKYISDPTKYKIGDGYLKCGALWRLSIDVDHRNYVMAYLGDLGRDLPECEQDYWKSFNVLTDERISKSSFMRDFMNTAMSTKIADVQFKNVYKELNDVWREKLGWPLFNQFAEGDEYNLENIRIPLSESQEEFDQQVLALNKTIVDSLNEKKIGKEIVLTKNMKGISKFEEWLKVKGITGYEQHISFLRDLQDLRSSGTGHRKGKEYQRIASKFQLSDSNRREDFERLLKSAILFINFLKSSLDSITD